MNSLINRNCDILTRGGDRIIGRIAAVALKDIEVRTIDGGQWLVLWTKIKTLTIDDSICLYCGKPK